MIMSEVQEEERKAELVTILECASKYKLVAGGRLWPSCLPLGKAPHLAEDPPRSGIAELMQHSEDFGQVVWPWDSHPTWPKSPQSPKKPASKSGIAELMQHSKEILSAST